MENKPEITIITPTYNRAATLHRVFDSLQSQTFKAFQWIIMDDGSTDNTKEVVEAFKQEAFFPIAYYYHPNQHKFLTVLEGIRKVDTKYHMVFDSDDKYPPDSLEILFTEAEKIENQQDFVAVMGLSVDEQGNIVGDQYPNDGFDGSIFDMRYKYKVRGDKNGIFISKTYQKLIEGKDFSKYTDKGYIPQSVLFNEYDSKGFKTRFINKIVRYYLKDENDEASVSNTRWTGKNVYGLKEGHLSFLNSYGLKLLAYPKALFRNLIGYQVFALKSNNTLSTIQGELKHPLFKILSIFTLPLSFLYLSIKS
ncbi:glycosyltransferase family A protein [Vaginella massiliensis]|uniref:glycosyltransferase family A protein n=1 Tax=Vaginella massiliensis TaxID=1816680 RepID=UPI0008383C7C|nr:glycosyltransferase family 2 protein [Vaginella massiliensis]